MQIVIVSDQSGQVSSLQALALEAGIKHAEGFNHPAAALDWCAENVPDLVLVDYLMRACDGLEFLRRFRAMSHLRNVPVLLMLPEVPGLASVRAAAWKLGVTDFLGTPVDPTEFVARVRNLLLLRAAGLLHLEASAPATMLMDTQWREPGAALSALAYATGSLH